MIYNANSSAHAPALRRCGPDDRRRDVERPGAGLLGLPDLEVGRKDLIRFTPQVMRLTRGQIHGTEGLRVSRCRAFWIVV